MISNNDIEFSHKAEEDNSIELKELDRTMSEFGNLQNKNNEFKVIVKYRKHPKDSSLKFGDIGSFYQDLNK